MPQWRGSRGPRNHKISTLFCQSPRKTCMLKPQRQLCYIVLCVCVCGGGGGGSAFSLYRSVSWTGMGQIWTFQSQFRLEFSIPLNFKNDKVNTLTFKIKINPLPLRPAGGLRKDEIHISWGQFLIRYHSLRLHLN